MTRDSKNKNPHQPIFLGGDGVSTTWSKQIKGIGNAQDPIVMATAWNLLHKEEFKS